MEASNMATTVAEVISAEEDNSGVDITESLESLKFIDALSDEEKQLVHLRKRSHALTATACAQATYFVCILNEARQIKNQLHNPVPMRASRRLLEEVTPRDAVHISVIGCGRMGSHLMHSLLTFGEVNPSEVIVSTRRPEMLTTLQEMGVQCFHDNQRAAASAHLLFLCVLPSQLPEVAADIRGHIRDGCTVYNMIAGVMLPRLQKLLQHTDIVKPHYTWSQDCSSRQWSHQCEITATFADPSMVEKTCPLSTNKDGAVIMTNVTFAEQMVYALVNMCSWLSLSRVETVGVVNAVVLGHSQRNPVQCKLTQQDITRMAGDDDKPFPKVNLSVIVDRETPLTQNFVFNRTIRDAYVEHYCDIFKQYLDWKKKSLQQAKEQLVLTFE
ncbi:NADP-dependent oxidoreductase domain-containing protein 1 [Lamellibrachia satsuma]|nr:NADP-dependent oxidoreductase domain-containing protein 1 [Lamellibrachia satsuma]